MIESVYLQISVIALLISRCPACQAECGIQARPRRSFRKQRRLTRKFTENF
jgi:hypothetical protein